MDTIEPKKRTRVRAYPPEFKARLVAESEQPGASVAKVALAHGLNANMLHTWRRDARGSGGGPADRKPEFVPLPLSAPVPPTGAAIRIELRRGATSIAVAWPVEAADSCAAWMRELLR
jgi:transposase